ncbi:MAG: hypothetical protein LBF97_04440, partial [Elusimicrobiota bacterium]|nr:hypothetical protein [Elusimicrobiota bacterium]
QLTNINITDTVNNNININIYNYLKSDAYKVEILKVACHANAITATHQKTFGKYKNCHQGQDVVLVATGPTLNDYEPIEGAIHLGVNSAFKFEKVILDYLFFQDYIAPSIKPYINELNNYVGNNCKKFYGILQDTISRDWIIPESDTILANAERYYVLSIWKYPPTKFTYDIANEILHCGHNVAITCMQFILWTNPKKIYLVGCDCNSGGYFHNNSDDVRLSVESVNNFIYSWSKMKDFAKTYYPDTEIISVNPVGLKGMFKDIYTKQNLFIMTR